MTRTLGDVRFADEMSTVLVDTHTCYSTIFPWYSSPNFFIGLRCLASLEILRLCIGWWLAIWSALGVANRWSQTTKKRPWIRSCLQVSTALSHCDGSQMLACADEGWLKMTKSLTQNNLKPWTSLIRACVRVVRYRWIIRKRLTHSAAATEIHYNQPIHLYRWERPWRTNYYDVRDRAVASQSQVEANRPLLSPTSIGRKYSPRMVGIFRQKDRSPGKFKTELHGNVWVLIPFGGYVRARTSLLPRIIQPIFFSLKHRIYVTREAHSLLPINYNITESFTWDYTSIPDLPNCTPSAHFGGCSSWSLHESQRN